MTTEANVPEFGKPIRDEFMLRETSVFLNHGSYGCVPRGVHERQVRYLVEMETHPDIWFRYSLQPNLEAAITKVAEFVGTSPHDTFLLQNATKAVNTVLKSYPFKSGDAFLITSRSYPAMANASHVTTTRHDEGKTYTMDIHFPIKSAEDIVEQYEKYLTEHPDIKLAIVDHITSPTSVLMPIKEIVEVCHRHDVITVIDGAHAPGQLKLDLVSVDTDFYTGNLHKWLYTPRGCAFLWMNPRRKHSWLRPLITSNFHGNGLPIEFGYEGTKDDTPFVCAIDGINYYNRIGGHEKILEYTTSLRERGIKYLEEKWGTKRLSIPESMVAPNIQMVELPHIPDFSDNQDLFNELQKLLVDRFDVQIAILKVEDKLMARLSTQVYCTMEDIEKLADAVLTLSREPPETSSKWRNSSWKPIIVVKATEQ